MDSSSTILTGSSDGMVRAVEIFPTKLRDVVVDLGDWPVERIVIGQSEHAQPIDVSDDEDETPRSKGASGGGDEEEEEEGTDGADLGRWWMAVAGQDNVLKLSSLQTLFGGNAEDSDAEDEDKDEKQEDTGGDRADAGEPGEASNHSGGSGEEEDSDSESEPEPISETRKRGRKANDPFSGPQKKGKNEIEADTQFFDEL